jgi:hypothetical protein
MRLSVGFMVKSHGFYWRGIGMRDRNWLTAFVIIFLMVSLQQCTAPKPLPPEALADDAG